MNSDASNKRRIATVGMFDGVHLGHQHVIRQLHDIASKEGLTATVYTFDRHPLSLIAPERAPKLISDNGDKGRLLEAAGADEVRWIVFNEEVRNLTAKEFLTLLHSTDNVDKLIVGFNHHFGRDRIGTFEQYRDIGAEIGIDVIQADEHTDTTLDTQISSSAIRQALINGDIALANKMLGRQYSLSGIVEHGRNIGTQIGFPTANVKPGFDNLITPGNGVYACIAQVDGKQYPAMVNIGINPTVNADEHPLTIEANIIGFDGDLYGKSISLSFVSRIRDEVKFDSLAALQSQLQADRAATLSLLINQI